MQIRIEHESRNRIRFRVPFKCTTDVQHYLLKLVLSQEKITKLQFYSDQITCCVFFEEGDRDELVRFIKRIDISKLRECYEQPQYEVAITPYSIVCHELLKHWLYQWLLPRPLKWLRTLWKASTYITFAVQSLCRKELTMDVLDSTAIMLSIIKGDYKTASTIMFILELGGKLNQWSQKKSIEDLEFSLESKISEVWVSQGNERLKQRISTIRKGDIIVVSEGQVFPFEGIVHSGVGKVNESSITGEFFPVSKAVGDVIYSNTVLEQGELLIEVTNNQLNYRVRQLVELVRESEHQAESHQYKFIEAADRLVKYNFMGAALTYALTRSFNKALSFLLVDYSCALKLSTPIVYLSAIKRLIEEGVVIKQTTTLDAYRKADTYVFDKTGTITTSKPVIQEILTFEGYTQEEVLRIGACLEEHVYHPIANAVVNKAEQEGIIHDEMHAELYHIASKGIKSLIDGDRVVIGSRTLIEDEGIKLSVEQEELIAIKGQMNNLLFLGYREKLIAIFCIDITLRPEAATVLRQLKELGKRIILLTGDTLTRTQKILEQIEVDEYYTDMTPEEKYLFIQRERHQGHKVMMIGDGLNDSAALTLSDIGVVMGDGADISKQLSDVLLTSENLTSLLDVERVSTRLLRKVNYNVTTTVLINTALIGLGLFNLIPTNLLAILHNVTTFGIVLRSFEK